MKAVRVRSYLRQEIEAIAIAAYPREACGVFIGTPEYPLDQFQECRNEMDERHARDPVTYPRTSKNGFVIHGRDLLTAHRLAYRTGRLLTGFFHSHPDADAYFSDEDARQALFENAPLYPDVIHVVTGTEGRQIRATKAFAWERESRQFVELKIDTTP